MLTTLMPLLIFQPLLRLRRRLLPPCFYAGFHYAFDCHNITARYGAEAMLL